MEKKRDIILDILKKDKNNLYHLYEKSITNIGKDTYFLVKKVKNGSKGSYNKSWFTENRSSCAELKLLGVYFENKKSDSLSFFEPEIQYLKTADNGKIKSLSLFPANSKNLSGLKKIFPHLCPSALKNSPSFGFGDRLGIATPGHIRAINMHKGLLPVFAQQSIRELTRTRRNYRDVIDSAAWGIFQEGYSGKWGADADHLKDKNNLLNAIKSGCTMFTIDTSDYLNEKAFDGSESLNSNKNQSTGNNQSLSFKSIGKTNNIKSLLGRYSGKKIKIRNYILKYDEDTIAALFFVYGKALDFVCEIYNFIKQNTPAFDFEVSFDETKTVTSFEAHYFIVNELQLRNLGFTSLALRFPGEFFKGVDYVGDIKDFRRSIETHGEIANKAGNYKLSLHSGSDKFSIYPDFYKHSFGNFHIKTAGTSWLIALHVIAECNPELFREIYNIAIDSFEINKKDYHLILKLSELPQSTSGSKDAELGSLLYDNRIRQCLHISYGAVLDKLANEVYEVLGRNEEKHYQFVSDYLNRHLDLLQ